VKYRVLHDQLFENGTDPDGRCRLPKGTVVEPVHPNELEWPDRSAFRKIHEPRAVAANRRAVVFWFDGRIRILEVGPGGQLTPEVRAAWMKG